MKHISRRKSAKRKYKRLIAALAGAAIVSSAILPGLPLAKVQAAKNQEVTAPASILEENQSPDKEPPHQEQANKDKPDKAKPNEKTKPNRDRDRPAEQPKPSSSPVAVVKAAAATYGFDARHDSFSLQSSSSTEAIVLVHTASGKTFKVLLTKSNNQWKITNVKSVVSGEVHAGNPVAIVKANAGTFNFDASKDHFTLLSESNGKAVVQVKTSGQTFKVDLVQSGGRWVITTIRGIGNSQYPATYRPASLYGYKTPVSALPVLTLSERILYLNSNFTDWTWRESGYPNDMKLGVMLTKPDPNDPRGIPDVIIKKTENIDFGRQFVLYAHIGSVSEQGYGIAIEQAVQTGNNIIVTIRTKSPSDNRMYFPSITNDLIPIDRLVLDFGKPIIIKFIDQQGTVLSNYTFH